MNDLKKIAFVAMPFRTKPTDLPPGKGPSVVDFDALWQKAIYPALLELDYLPIRADNQTGSVIIKDMLEQLVYADLVLADISIPNGNVYYEAGVRHAARQDGCILISADWAAPLFDLGQITQLRYALSSDDPSDTDYLAIIEQLKAGIPALSASEGPVYTLTRIGDSSISDARHLKEISSVLFDFQTELRAAKLKARDGEKEPLRAFLDSNYLEQLPTYAITELVEAFRDNLNWGELQALIASLPESMFDDPFFLEEKALAMAKQGHVHDAIALLEQMVEKRGETPERLGTIGGRYRELARDEPNRQKKKKHQAKAIKAYRRGMQLDLNQYYCAHKLLVTLIERDRPGDKEEAAVCAARVLAAGQRAQALNRTDEWLNSALLVHAFFDQDHTRARTVMNEMLDQEWANWKLVTLSQDLNSALLGIGEAQREPFQEIIDELFASLPIKQGILLERVLPMIIDKGGQFKKSKRVHARPANEGEIIVSVTEDGEETSNTAKAGDMVVKNLTEAQEQYLVGQEKFDSRYTALEKVDDIWTLYEPIGEIRAIEVTHEMTTLLDVGEEFYIMAPWNTEQFAREGDYLVAPLPALDEIYRIARSEFEQTYELK